MNYVEFVDTIKTMLGYEGNDIEPLKFSPVIGNRNQAIHNLQQLSELKRLYAYKVRGYNLSEPLSEEIRERYELFLENIGYDNNDSPSIPIFHTSPDGWYISNQGYGGNNPLIYYLNQKDDVIYVFNPYDLYRRLWFNAYKWTEYYDVEVSVRSKMNIYLGLNLLKPHKLFTFINWNENNPLKGK